MMSYLSTITPEETVLEPYPPLPPPFWDGSGEQLELPFPPIKLMI